MYTQHSSTANWTKQQQISCLLYISQQQQKEEEFLSSTFYALSKDSNNLNALRNRGLARCNIDDQHDLALVDFEQYLAHDTSRSTHLPRSSNRMYLNLREKVKRRASKAMEFLIRAKYGIKKNSSKTTNDEFPGKMQPTQRDVELLKWGDPKLFEVVIRDCGLQLFYDLFMVVENTAANISETDLENTIFCVNESKEDVKEYKDLMIRAKKLVEEIQKKNSDILYLLDGHGRMVLCVLHFMHQMMGSFDAFEIIVVDINKHVHNFHEYFFPKEIKCQNADMLKVLGRFQERDAVYFNFCSIPDKKSNFFMNKDEVIKCIFELDQHNVVMLGFTNITRRGHSAYTNTRNGRVPLGTSPPPKNDIGGYKHLSGKGLADWLEEEIWGSENQKIADLISSRGDYFTYLIKMDVIHTLKNEQCEFPAEIDDEYADVNWSVLKQKFWEHGLEYDMRTDLELGACVRNKLDFKEGTVTKRTMCSADVDYADGEPEQKVAHNAKNLYNNFKSFETVNVHVPHVPHSNTHLSPPEIEEVEEEV